MSEEPVLITTAKTTTLGERLKEAREAKKISIAEVAAQLRLKKEIFSYLENQEWDRFNGRTYARGYFVSYIKFLGLPYDEMMAIFNLEYTAAEPAVNLRQRYHVREEKRFPWFVLIFIVIVTLLVWFAYHQWQALQQADNDITSLSESADKTQMVNSSNDIVAAPETKVIKDEEEVVDTINSVVEITQPKISTDSQTDESTEAELILREIDSITETNNSQSNVKQTLEANELATLQMTFSGECWVKITSANNRVLVNKVMQADDSLTLSVPKPLEVVLGQTDMVTMYYNNEQVDLRLYTQGKIARLTLGLVQES